MPQVQSANLERDTPSFFTGSDSASMSPTGNHTLAGWFRLESLPGTDTEFRILFKYASGNGSYIHSLVDEGGTKKIIIQLTAGGTTLTQAGVTWSPSTNTWYHIAWVYTAAGGTLDVYLNGAQQGTQQSGLPTSVFDGTEAFSLGRNSNFTGGNFDGDMDDVRFWGRALSSSEITDLYGNGCTFANGSNLNAWWEFEVGAETTDSSGNSNTLTNNNSVTFTSTVPYTCSTAVSRRFMLMGVGR